MERDSDDNDDSTPTSSNINSTLYDLGPPSSTIDTIATTTSLTQYNPVRYVIKAGEHHVYALNASDEITNNYINYYATSTLCDMPDWDQDGTSLRIQLANNITQLTKNATEDPYYSYFERGFANLTSTRLPATASTNSMAYLVIMAPTINDLDLTGDSSVNSNDTWTYEVGISTISPLHQAFFAPNLYLVDTDFAHVLLLSGNMTSPATPGQGNTSSNYTSDLFYTNTSTYYGLSIFKSDSSLSTSAIALDWSYCAMSTSTEVLLNTENALASVTTRGIGGLPKIQYFTSGLNKSTSYVAYLTETTNHSAASVHSSQIFGGKVFGGVNFTTKSETNCQLVFDLDLCSDVAFAVPGNADKFSAQELAAAYDDQARELFDSFNTSMDVIQCGEEVDTVDRYSILRTCDDCRESYRQWLCATTIPRCEDSSETLSYLYLRDVNSSRTSFINDVIQPGPYNEVLPCIDLCHGIMQDCPSSFSFQCPRQGLPGFTGAYYIKEGTNDITCNYPGVVYIPNSSSRLVSKQTMAWASLVTTLLLVWL